VYIINLLDCTQGCVYNIILYCYFSDFAYPTVKDRMPVILSKVVDTVFRMKAQVTVEFGTVSKVSRSVN